MNNRVILHILYIYYIQHTKYLEIRIYMQNPKKVKNFKIFANFS